MYYQSPLLFYLTYIAKVPDDTPVPVCYGLSGTIVHDCLERYARQELDRDGVYRYFMEQWEQQDLGVHSDLRGEPLDQFTYLTAVIKGMHIIDQHADHLCEEMISFPLAENEFMKIGVKGVIDLQATEKSTNQQVIIDYKTSNALQQGKQFERQALFYNLLLHAQKNILPAKTNFHYLKLDVAKEYRFSEIDVQLFYAELQTIAETLLSYGTAIENYPVGDIHDLFNTKKQACLREVARREACAALSAPLPVADLG
jgi:hypothetical protein